MLSLEIASGPKADKYGLDSYLFPFFEELEQLGEGIAAYDAHIDAYFSLKAWLPETHLRYRSYFNYRITPELIPVELARSPAQYISINILQKVEWTKERLARIHAVIIRFLHPPNFPPRYPSTNAKEHLSSLPMRILMISPFALMMITSMMIKQVWRIQICAIHLISKMYHHLHSFQQYLFPPQFRLTSCI